METMRDINTTALAEEKKKDKEIWPSWVIDMEKKYESYDPSEYELSLKKKCIYKWPSDLVITSSLSKHRTPHMASFGPYHHGNKNLQPMEQHKQRAVYRILNRSRVSLYSFIESLEGIEQELRDSYDNLEPNCSDSYEPVFSNEGMLTYSSDSYEPVFSNEGMLTYSVALRDMLLLENQIPLLVLRKLVEVGKLCQGNSDGYLNQLMSKVYGLKQIEGSSLHILDIYRKSLITEQERTPSEEGFIKSVCMRCQPWLHVIGKGIKQMPLAIPILFYRLLAKHNSKPGNVRSAMRFHEAGIEFKKGDSESGLKINFDKDHGVLTLPFIGIDDNTAAIYMNLMAFERMHRFHASSSAACSRLAFAARQPEVPELESAGASAASSSAACSPLAFAARQPVVPELESAGASATGQPEVPELESAGASAACSPLAFAARQPEVPELESAGAFAARPPEVPELESDGVAS